MSNLIPSHLTNMALIIKGNIRAGIFPKVDLPTLKRKMETIRPPGTSHPIEVDMGPDGALIMKLESSELEPLILADYGICNGQQARIHLKSAFKQPTNCSLNKHEVLAQGTWTEISLGSQEIGSKVSRSYTLSCLTFRYLINGKVIIDIDALAADPKEKELLGL